MTRPTNRKLTYAVLAAALLAGLGAWARPDAVSRVVAAVTGKPASNGPAETGPRDGRAGGAGAKVAVEVAQSRLAKATTDIPSVGSLRSDEAVALAPELPGRVSEIVFAEGEPVKKNAVIVKLDDALIRAELAQAKARLTLAEANNERAESLAKTGSGTIRARDEAASAFAATTADVELAEARLSKMVLRAPFDGVAGVRNISVGAYVAAGTPIVNIEKIDRLKVDFKLPETALQQTATGQDIDVEIDALPGRRFKGQIYAINPLVDVNGRALQVRASLPNPEGVLRPGLFARVTVKGLKEREVVVVPESAILPRGGDSYVYRVSNDGKAVESKVKLGHRSAGAVEILEGLAADTTVIVAGQQKLRDGAPVEILPAAQAPANAAQPALPAPQPQNGGKSG